MAIVNNFWLKDQRKQLAGAVIYQAMGQTRSRKLAETVSNPRTDAQMSHRVKWANLVNFYRANQSWMKYAYETKKTNQSEYNKFMSLNVSSSRIYLPKNLASQGACVVDGYTMTQGSLASIEVTSMNGGWKTNLFLPNSPTITELSTVGEVTQLLLPMNPALREGDQLSFIRITQQTNSITGVPFVVVRKYEVVLNSSDVRPFYNFMPWDYIKPLGIANQNCIKVVDSGLAGGFLLILSRTVGGRTSVSTQSIIVANNSQLITAYSSDNALVTAIDSYGESDEPFLTSTTADQDSQAAVMPSVISVLVESSPYVPGQVAFVELLNQDDNIYLRTSAPLQSTTIEDITLTYWNGGTLHTAELNNPRIEAGLIAGQLELDNDVRNVWLNDIIVQSTQETLRAVFGVPNEATIQGLE